MRHSFSEEKSVPGGWLLTSGEAEFLELEGAAKFITVSAADADEAVSALSSVSSVSPVSDSKTHEEGENSRESFVRVVLPEGTGVTAEDIRMKLSETPVLPVHLSVASKNSVDEKKTNSGKDAEENPEEKLKNALFDVRGVLETYFEQNLPEGSDPSFFASLAKALLDGEPAEDVWGMLKAGAGARKTEAEESSAASVENAGAKMEASVSAAVSIEAEGGMEF